MAKKIKLTIFYCKTTTGWKALYWGDCQIYGFIESRMGQEREAETETEIKAENETGTGTEIATETGIETEIAAETGIETEVETETAIGVCITGIRQGRKKVTVMFQKREGADGYEIAYRKGQKGKYHKIRVNAAEKNKVVLRKLKPGAEYYVKVRSYVYRDGKKCKSAYSEPVKFRRKSLFS